MTLFIQRNDSDHVPLCLIYKLNSYPYSPSVVLFLTHTHMHMHCFWRENFCCLHLKSSTFLHCLLHILMYIFFLPQTECLCTFFLLYIAFHIIYMNIKIDHGLAPISGTYNSPSLMYNNCLPAC